MPKPTLKLGSTGAAVTLAKKGINHWNAKGGNTTPLFGIFFLRLVKQFQTANRIPATGVIGPATWKALEPHIAAATRPPIPNLGPICAAGRSVLDHDLTHATSGIDLYPAFDDAFVQGQTIVAPEALTVTKESHSRPGLAFYCTGQSKIRYWFGHLDRTHPPGTRFAKGQAIGRVAVNTIGGGPHCHVGVNVELLIGTGRQLVHHTNYTHGAPTIRTQLEAWAAT